MVEKHVKIQIETHFKETLKTLQGEVVAFFSPLVKHSQQDVERLNLAVNHTNNLCQEIQRKYNFRWSRPFVILILSTALTGALMGLMLYLMQISPLAVFLMYEEIRRTYDKGYYRFQLEEVAKRMPPTKDVQNLKKNGYTSH